MKWVICINHSYDLKNIFLHSLPLSNAWFSAIPPNNWCSVYLPMAALTMNFLVQILHSVYGTYSRPKWLQQRIHIMRHAEFIFQTNPDQWQYAYSSPNEPTRSVFLRTDKVLFTKQTMTHDGIMSPKGDSIIWASNYTPRWSQNMPIGGEKKRHGYFSSPWKKKKKEWRKLKWLQCSLIRREDV